MLAAALSVGLSHALDARGIQAEAMLGFSLGQISALMASGVLSDEDGFALLDVRARSMAQAARNSIGMYALLGAAHEDAQVSAIPVLRTKYWCVPTTTHQAR